MDEKEQAYKEIAMMRRAYFDWLKSDSIYALITSDDVPLLQKYYKLFGGQFRNKSGGHLYGDVRGATGRLMGDYEWQVRGETAYQFCLGILPYLRKYDTMRYNRCQQCIITHENRGHKQAAIAK